MNGEFHNESGPAVEKWNDKGELFLQSFYVNGAKLSEEEFIARVLTKSARKQ